MVLDWMFEKCAQLCEWSKRKVNRADSKLEALLEGKKGLRDIVHEIDRPGINGEKDVLLAKCLDIVVNKVSDVYGSAAAFHLYIPKDIHGENDILALYKCNKRYK